MCGDWVAEIYYQRRWFVCQPAPLIFVSCALVPSANGRKKNPHKAGLF